MNHTVSTDDPPPASAHPRHMHTSATSRHGTATMNHTVVTGGAGLLGSHLCRALLERGDRVTAIDNLSTGRRAAIENLTAHPRFTLRTADVTAPGALADLATVTHIAHLARPGSPTASARRPVDTLRAASTGTLAALDLAARRGARIVVASGSEISGESHHAPPSRGHLGNIGPASTFSANTAGSHVTEALARHYRGANVGIVRPFEVYGPHLWPGDGRVTASCCAAALRDQTLQVIDGDTRSFVYVADTVEAMVAMLDSEAFGPVDIGGPNAVTLAEFARTVIDLAGSGWLEVAPASTTDVTARSPDLTHARALLGWHPTTLLPDGLHHTLDWMRTILRPQ
ncbi:NAD-dependent epimerase/dehydratase family protein [Nocardia sp. NPDC052112]|uniref:NAD-dependent epimerase/dehydratase family protein n=1 Tax=Nocardia sp. NPDC052112 TaxID=3155646 RepID=UPI00343A9017